MNVLPKLVTDDDPPPEGPCYICREKSPLMVGRVFICAMHDAMVRRLSRVIWRNYKNYAEDRIASLEESLRIVQSKYEEALKELRLKSSASVEDEWYMQKGGRRHEMPSE